MLTFSKNQVLSPRSGQRQTQKQGRATMNLYCSYQMGRMSRPTLCTFVRPCIVRAFGDFITCNLFPSDSQPPKSKRPHTNCLWSVLYCSGSPTDSAASDPGRGIQHGLEGAGTAAQVCQSQRGGRRGGAATNPEHFPLKTQWLYCRISSASCCTSALETNRLKGSGRRCWGVETVRSVVEAARSAWSGGSRDWSSGSLRLFGVRGCPTPPGLRIFVFTQIGLST